MDQRVTDHGAYSRVLDATIAEIKKLGVLKGGEYSGDTDRLANFRRNAEDVGLRMEVVWRVYAGKHWDAITQYVRDVATNRSRERLESISGRCDDLILYLILFKCMLAEPAIGRAPDTQTDGPVFAMRKARGDT